MPPGVLSDARGCAAASGWKPRGLEGEESQSKALVKSLGAHPGSRVQDLTRDLIQQQSHTRYMGWAAPAQGWRREKIVFQPCTMAFVLAVGQEGRLMLPTGKVEGIKEGVLGCERLWHQAPKQRCPHSVRTP